MKPTNTVPNQSILESPPHPNQSIIGITAIPTPVHTGVTAMPKTSVYWSHCHAQPTLYCHCETQTSPYWWHPPPPYLGPLVSSSLLLLLCVLEFRVQLIILLWSPHSMAWGGCWSPLKPTALRNLYVAPRLSQLIWQKTRLSARPAPRTFGDHEETEAHPHQTACLLTAAAFHFSILRMQ